MDLARLKRVSRFVRSLVLIYEGSVFTLHRLYGSFFPASVIERFRVLLLSTRALVSGSAVVQFLSRSTFEPSDLDVFVNHVHVLVVGTFLQEVGYRFVPLTTVVRDGVKVSEQQDPDFEVAVRAEFCHSIPNTGDVADRYELTTIGGVFNFVKDGGSKVQVVSARTEPVEAILALVMNIATATEVISFYPRTSFVYKRALYLKQFTGAVAAAKEKYEARGWESYDVLSAVEFLRRGLEVSGKIRWVGDPHCWVVLFPPLSGYRRGVDDVYAALKVTSWHLFCPDPDCTRVMKNRMENGSLLRSYVVVWNAMMAVWHHPCFRCMDEHSVLTRKGTSLADLLQGTGEEVDSVSLSESVNSSAGTQGFDSKSWVFLDSPSCFVNLGAFPGPTFTPPRSLDAAIIDFLRGYYPLADLEYRNSWLLEQLRFDFGRLRESYSGRELPPGYPTAHVVTTILQCFEDIDLTGACDDVDIVLRFDEDRSSRRVVTRLDFVVAAERMSVIERESSAWTTSEEQMRDAGLVVALIQA
ncbi:hypothetical protein VNI00_013441 [Paramarasmius palmivorus]|uniref:Uncharacterized protein n=1 Tax=Paramarasmius palmivorus TaxID=297713 RepID=A0AAW0BYV4_9AGAR